MKGGVGLRPEVVLCLIYTGSGFGRSLNPKAKLFKLTPPLKKLLSMADSSFFSNGFVADLSSPDKCRLK